MRVYDTKYGDQNATLAAMNFHPALLLTATLLAAGNSHAATAVSMAIPFVEDDYASVLRDARARQVPIFIEAWAPW